MNDHKLPQISILGCGWLGLPLGEHLAALGYPVKGSTTRPEKLKSLEEKGIAPYTIKILEEEIVGDFSAFTTGSKILIADIPPGLRRDQSRHFPNLIKVLLSALAFSEIDHLLYISSTSVFPDREIIYTEDTTPQPDTNSGKQLLEAEHLIHQDSRSNTVLRLGGLIGPDRHPATYLSGKNNLPEGSKRINLIHRKDCIGLIRSILEKSAWDQTLHGVAPYHPTKKDYYPAMAKLMQLPLPSFLPEEHPTPGKAISSQETTELLSYKFRHPTLDHESLKG